MTEGYQNPSPTLFDMPVQGVQQMAVGQPPFMVPADDAPSVLAYRMGQVEQDVKSLLQKFDGIASHYVTPATLMLALDPVKERVSDLETKDKEREQRKSNESSQFKLAISVAILSPIFNLIVILLLGTGQ